MPPFRLLPLLGAAVATASLVCNYAGYPNINFDGVNLPNQPAATNLSTGAECAALCCSAPGCTSFTLNAGSANQRWCYLKSNYTQRVNPGVDSGVINGTAPTPSPTASPVPKPPPFLDAVADCGCDATGVTDTTARLQACIDRAYSTWGFIVPRIPVLLPPGVYLVSDTITLAQSNPGPDDGINVVPGRFLPHVLVGAPVAAAGGARPTLRLAASSPGFSGAVRSGGGATPYKPVVSIYSTGGEGVDMNNLFKGIDIDLTLPGNAGAAGISHPGAQGATVTDVTVRAAPDTFACFAGMNGAGGMHAHAACYGARYGVYLDDSQPVPVGVGLTLVNQSVSAVLFFGQETLSLVGAEIVVPPGASGPAIATGSQGMTIVDCRITCSGASAQAVAAINTTRSLYVRDLYVEGCGVAIAQPGHGGVAGPPAGQWLHFAEYALGVDDSAWYLSSALYVGGERQPDGSSLNVTALLPPGAAPPADLQSRHLWNETSFPDRGAPGVADAVGDCGAVGDGEADDTVVLQSCLDTHVHVFLPRGLFRVSATLTLPPGGSLVGFANGVSYIAAASAGGFANASAAEPAPLIRTDDGADAPPTVLAFVGVVTWQHLPQVSTLDWRSRNPLSVWRVNFESRDCECLWLSAYQQLTPPVVPCSLPSNMTAAKSVFRGLGRVYSFVNDDTGAILSSGATYRSLLVADTVGVAAPDAKLRFYSLNLEHAQSEANAELRNASFVDIYSVKSEGNTPVLWLRDTCTNVSVLGLGGGITPFAFNFTFPPDFAQLTASLFRVDAGARGITFAALLDHGYGASPPYWPPSGGGCKWLRHYPYPGTAVPLYPFSTFPNVTMWNCWYGESVATTYWYMIADGASGHTQPKDKPIYWSSPL